MKHYHHKNLSHYIYRVISNNPCNLNKKSKTQKIDIVQKIHGNIIILKCKKNQNMSYCYDMEVWSRLDSSVIWRAAPVTEEDDGMLGKGHFDD